MSKVKRPKISKSLEDFNASTGSRRERIFKEEIYPFTEDIISGVLLSLNVVSLPEETIKDIRQEIYVKVLAKDIPPLSGIRSIKNYYFVIIKNIALDYLRSEQRVKTFNSRIREIVNNKADETGNRRPDR